MKRFISVLSSLLVLPAFAEVAPVYYDEIVEYTDGMLDANDATVDEAKTETVGQQNVAQRTTINRSTSASRAISSGSNAASRTNTSSRAVASSPRTATGASRSTTARTTRTPVVANRTASTTSRATVTSRNTQNAKPVTARVGISQNTPVASVLRGGTTTGSAEVTDSGKSLYNPTTANSRIGVANRRASARLSSTIKPTTTTTTITQEEVTTTTNNLAAIAELTDYCKAQYAACMDNYCNVLDDNQGRCSCSKNLKNYEKTEQALAEATENFQNVVQQIRYIGLTTDQVNALFDETEAELTMKSNSDSSRLKTSLDAIKKKIIDVSTPSASSYVSTTGISLDMNGLLSADFSTGFDLNSFLNMNNSNTTSVSNQRGEQLYKSATNRCKTAVLNSCTAQGIEANVITNSYDLEIDKQCVLYERSLNDANAEMKSNVTNAATILQQARLLLAQNKNSYDLRSCVAAIDSCMQDEYVCGPDYELCLDPTGKYLSDGEIVKGGTPGVSGGQVKTNMAVCATTEPQTCGNIGQCNTGNTCVSGACVACQTLSGTTNPWTSNGMWNLYSTWDYTKDTSTYNAWSFGEKENLGGYVDYWLDKWKTEYQNSSNQAYTTNLAEYLLQKVGYIDKNDKVHGMCASVMKQCQDYTFDTKNKKKTYKPDNEVVRQYLNTTLTKIKVQQDAILADYAEGCRADVQSCLSTNGYEDSNTNSTASKTAINACAAEITTCMSVGGYQINDGIHLTLRAMTDWVNSILLSCPTNTYLYDANDVTECRACYAAPVFAIAPEANADTCNATGARADCPYEQDVDESYVRTVSSGGRVTDCSCPDGYEDLYVIDVDNIRLTTNRHVCIKSN